ncbi:MAG TPA: hypothetical protein PKD55_15790, partial [Bellilinea sp.]|nr:hypothetical protein [Bellilinea sp.]
IYANSVIGGISKHEEFNAVVRNEFLRRHGNKSSAAIVMMLGYMSADMRHRLVQMGDGSVLPAGAMAGLDLSSSISSELYWVCTYINSYLADRWWNRFLRFWCWPKAVRPTNGWKEVLPVLRQIRITIPAPPDFDENAYLLLNPDVAKSVRDGKQRSGYMHYLLHGRTEGRIRS